MSQETGGGQGFMDRLKSRMKLGESKVKEVVKDRESQIRDAVDKAEGFVDSKTKGKYHDKISKVGAKADSMIDKATKEDADAAAAEAKDAAADAKDAAADASGAASDAKDAAAAEANDAAAKDGAKDAAADAKDAAADAKDAAKDAGK